MGGLCQKRPGAALCWTQLFAAGSTTDLLLAKAVALSKAGGTPVKTYLRKGKTLHNSEE